MYDEYAGKLIEQIVGRALPSAAVVIDPPGSARRGVSVVPGRGERSVVESFFRLLKSTVTIDDMLDECHALDFHERSDDEDQLVRTDIGEECYRAKYRHSEVDRERLTRRFLDFISVHPTYANAGLVASVPACDGGEDGLSRRLVDGIVRASGRRHVRVDRVSGRPPQKGVGHDDPTTAEALRKQNQLGSMMCRATLNGAAVIVVDDLYGSGATVAEAARALKQADAGAVVGLAATKQLRFTQRR